MKVLALHAYSADNAGDGLLVTRTLELIREALGADTEITVIASRPASFAAEDVRVVPAVPTKRGYSRAELTALRHLDEFDLVVGVGGGYLRADSLVGLAKAALVQGPQLVAAARTSTRSVYLPQSIGPVPRGLRRATRALLSRIDSVFVRDDRSLDQFRKAGVVRGGDLALLDVPGGRRAGTDVDPTPVLSIRAVHGSIPGGIPVLAGLLGDYDVYVQSTVGGNDDRPASVTLQPRSVVERAALLSDEGPRRVVVAVRLHAALMALAAGHYVVHLAYERKGYGAFADLGLDRWVHPVTRFSPVMVARQARALLGDPQVRADYDQAILAAGPRFALERDRIVETLRGTARDS